MPQCVKQTDIKEQLTKDVKTLKASTMLTPQQLQEKRNTSVKYRIEATCTFTPRSQKNANRQLLQSRESEPAHSVSRMIDMCSSRKAVSAGQPLRRRSPAKSPPRRPATDGFPSPQLSPRGPPPEVVINFGKPRSGSSIKRLTQGATILSSEVRNRFENAVAHPPSYRATKPNMFLIEEHPAVTAVSAWNGPTAKGSMLTPVLIRKAQRVTQLTCKPDAKVTPPPQPPCYQPKKIYKVVTVKADGTEGKKHVLVPLKTSASPERTHFTPASSPGPDEDSDATEDSEHHEEETEKKVEVPTIELPQTDLKFPTEFRRKSKRTSASRRRSSARRGSTMIPRVLHWTDAATISSEAESEKNMRNQNLEELFEQHFGKGKRSGFRRTASRFSKKGTSKSKDKFFDQAKKEKPNTSAVPSLPTFVCPSSEVKSKTLGVKEWLKNNCFSTSPRHPLILA